MVNRAIRIASTLLRDRRGVSALEFGILAPVLFGLLLAVFDLGYSAQEQMQLHEALRAGGQYAMSFPSDTAGITSAIQAVLPSGLEKITIATPTDSCTCWSAGGSAGCNSSGNACSTGYTVERFKTLSASAAYAGSLINRTISTSYVVRYQ